MKKLFILTCLGFLTLTSCKKDYTCECSIVEDGEILTSTSTTINDTKSKAKEACDGGDIAETDFIFGVKCEIK